MINFICFIEEVNFTLQTGPALFKFTRTRLLYNFAGKSIISYFKACRHLARLQSSRIQ